MGKSRITIESDEPNALSFFLDLRRLSSQIADLQSQSEQHERLLRRIIEKENQQMATTSQLLEAVTAQRTVLDGVGSFISELKAALAAQGVAQADIDKAFEGVTANTATAALFTNTETPAPVA